MRLRSHAFPTAAFGLLALLSTWWLPADAALAASYPPTLGCAVTGSVTSGGIEVQGVGFRTGSQVRISAAGSVVRAIADATGGFETWLPARTAAAGSALTATGPGCTAHGSAAGDSSTQPGKSPFPGQPGSPPGSIPPNAAIAAQIPVVPLSHVPSRLFLGLAGAVLLAGAALTGLTGRWGHRAEGRPSPGASVSGSVPVAPDHA